MMNVVDAWPFLVSRNRKFGYRTVVAPQFIYEQKLSGLLAEVAGGDLTDEGYARYRKIQSASVGDLILVYHVVRARKSHIGLEEDETLTDQFGRPIDLVEGIVLKEGGQDIVVANEDLQMAHTLVEEAYRVFWNETTTIPVVKPSTSFPLQGHYQTNKQLILQKERPFYVRPSTKAEWLDLGSTHYEAKRYEEALMAFEKAIQIDSNDAQVYNSKGNALYQLNRNPEALIAYEKAIQIDANYALPYNNKGNILRFYVKDYKEALTFYEKAIRINPDFSTAYYNKGRLLYFLKRYKEALTAYEKTIHIEPTSAPAHSAKGYALYHLYREEEAITSFNQAIQLDSHFVSAYNGKGMALQFLRRYEEALVAYEKANELDPNDTNIQSNRNNILKILNRL